MVRLTCAGGRDPNGGPQVAPSGIEYTSILRFMFYGKQR